MSSLMAIYLNRNSELFNHHACPLFALYPHYTGIGAITWDAANDQATINAFRIAPR